MKSLTVTIPYPPSVNKTYFNRSFRRDIIKQNHLRGRGLTKAAKDYKMLVAVLISKEANRLIFGEQTVKVTILDNPANLRGDNHNCEKIVFDAIEMSGVIYNDKQIISHEMIPGRLKNPGSWTIKIEPCERLLEDVPL